MFKKGLSSLVVAAFLTASAGQALAAEESDETSGSVDLTNVTEETSAISNDMVTPFSSVNVGGGTWDYGTSLALPLNKKVWSNFNHPSKKHSASCSIGNTYSSSGVYPAGSMAPSSAKGGINDSTRANWDVH